jgi:BirA family biotin operon repressor/biotin-[acetyl-CoA-carboxylase] ligase
LLILPNNQSAYIKKYTRPMLTFHIGKFDQVESTNNLLKDLVQKEAPAEGRVVCTDYQTNGKGTGKNTWESERGKNLLLSLYLKPDFLSAERQFLLSISISLALIDALNMMFKSNYYAIKWPNDIYYKDKKIGGILIENALKGSTISECIIGIGINLNQTKFSNTIPNPISFIQVAQKEFDKQLMLCNILTRINYRYLQIKNGSYKQLRDEYLGYMFQLNQERSYKIEGKTQKGIILGIDDFGQLVVKVGPKTRVFGFKEIEYVLG